jgi:hypothetical protein
MMIAPILVSLALAMVFGIVTQSVVGTENLLAYAWVDAVFWSTIGAGVGAAAISALLGCRICRNVEGRLHTLCRESACR